MLKIFKLALRVFKTELRKSAWWVIFFSIFISITGITAVHFYIDRLEQGLKQESIRFLGGDLVITRASVIPYQWHEKAKSLQLQTAEVWTYPSMIHFQNKMQLAMVQAVSNNYPLIGKIQHIPPKTVWVDARLLSNSLEINQTLKLGVSTFKIGQTLTADIDQLNTGWPIAPRMMINTEDVPDTKTVVPGSRIEYRLLLTGKPQNLQAFKTWVKPQLLSADRFIDSQTQRLPLQTIIEKTFSYIQITLFICLMLSAIAIILSLKYYLQQQQEQIALWRCLGASKSQLIQIFLWQLFLIAFSAGSLGLIAGLGAQHIFENIFRDFFPFMLPSPQLKTWVAGFSLGFILLFMFSLPQLLELPAISPLRIWRNDFNVRITHWTFYLAIFSYFFLLFAVIYLQLTPAIMGTLLAIGLMCSALYGLSIVFLKTLKIIEQHVNGPWRQGLKRLTHNAKYFNLQFVCFNLIIIGIVLLSLIKGHLIHSFLESLPQKTPNYFLINILKEEIPSLENILTNNKITIDAIYPMVRGRLIKINNKNIFDVVPKENQSHNALHRELNLSWMWNFPTDNKVVAGRAWQLNLEGQAVVSIEKQLASDLNIKLGDDLTFQIGEKKIDARVIQFRTLNWTSFHPNFFIIFPPGVIENFAATYITSLYLSPKQAFILRDLSETFPNLTVIDVAHILSQIQQILAKILIAISYLFYFALALAIVVLISALQTILPEHQKIYRLMFILGAKKSFLQKSLLVEIVTAFTVIGTTAWFLSYFIAHIMNWYYFT